MKKVILLLAVLAISGYAFAGIEDSAHDFSDSVGIDLGGDEILALSGHSKSLVLSGHYTEGKLAGRPSIRVCQKIKFDLNRKRFVFDRFVSEQRVHVVVGNLDFIGPPVKFDQLKLFLPTDDAIQDIQPFTLKDGDKLEIIWYNPQNGEHDDIFLQDAQADQVMASNMLVCLPRHGRFCCQLIRPQPQPRANPSFLEREAWNRPKKF